MTHSGQTKSGEFSVLCVSDKELWHLNNSEFFTQPEHMQLLQHLILWPLLTTNIKVISK